VIRRLAVPLAVVALACTTSSLGCTTSPTGRQTLKVFSDDQMSQMGITAFEELKKETPISKDTAAQAYVRCVARAVTREISAPGAPSSWEVVVFEDDSANAFALPGGKIGVHTGLFEVATNQDQLATVIGHEVAHVLAGHSNERASTQLATSGALAAIETLSGPASPAKSRTLAVLGVGAQVGVILPFSRSQESEADVMGLDLMARAGFDPREGAALWENMAKLGSAGPEILSTHPSSSSRIANLRERAKTMLPLYEQARAAGKRPSCS
jgi:predicted Zn-dependent protease